VNRSSDELLAFIFDRISKIASIHEQDELLCELANMCRDIVYADRCSIWIRDKQQGILWTKIAQGQAPITMGEYQGIVGSAVEQNHSLIINDVQADSHFNHEVDKQSGYVTRRMIVIPMHNRSSEVVGAIQVINTKGDIPFSQTDLKHLHFSSLYVAESIKTMLLIEETYKTQKELIYIMGETGENRSRETGQHVKRVAEYSYLLAKLYGLDEKACSILRDVSPMHDIGKIGIADAILNKPGRLDEEEMRIMQTHATMGYTILKHSKLTLLKAAAIVAHEHHEKYDGTGYPKGLQGEAIHIYGRITAIADVFDALGSERVYKKAWSDEAILELFVRERGRHFDPALVDLFLTHQEQFWAIRDRFSDV